MTEEQVTLAILASLRASLWDVVSFDFPQSGTGTLLRPDWPPDSGERELGGIIPDVVAVKGGTCLVLENKPYFAPADVSKLVIVKTSGAYDLAFRSLLEGIHVDRMMYGIGLPHADAVANVEVIMVGLDVCLGVRYDRVVEVLGPRGYLL